MQFVKRGPDVPDRLLRQHEDGRVVFFCGAAISFPAGLPNFECLVRQVCEQFPGYPNEEQDAAINAGRHEEAIGLLENEVVGGKERVRRSLAEKLTPAPERQNATATHKALLTLGTNRDGRVRLVTTNFDRLFEKAIAKRRPDGKPSQVPLLPVPKIRTFEAPLLPIPNRRWNGLIYLHGLLPKKPTPENSTTEARYNEKLHNLVVSSADFGRAYLKEGWAARFISELFYDYTICFIGYGINDPVMRYMVDAWAEDKSLGESGREIFAFVDYAKSQKSAQENKWYMRGVTPILYLECKEDSIYKGHDYLHSTLKDWADIYQGDMRGKEKIVSRYVEKNPSQSTSEDDFVGRMLWALSDPSGLPAEHFAKLETVPPFEWLKAFCDDRYGMEDLDCFGKARFPVYDDQPLRFSLLRRPVSSDDHRSRMALVGAGADSVVLDDVMPWLGVWLARHLNNPELLFWVANQGGCLHSKFAKAVEERLDKIAQLERADKNDEMERIRTHASDAIPSPGMRAYWRLAVTGRLSRQDPYLDSHFWRLWHPWRLRFQRDGLTPSIRTQLCEMLRPRISLGRAFTGWFVPVQDKEEPARCIHPEIVLCDICHILKEDQQWKEALPDLMEDISKLLRDALDLMRELGEADDKNDWTYRQIPSISDHSQNKHPDAWTILITLCRDAWLAMAEKNPDGARSAAERWWRTPYPIFKRLALFSATQNDVIPVDRALDWLTAEDGWWLWSLKTMREAMRLLVALADKLKGSNLARIEQAILQGPPRTMYKEDIQEEDWNSIVDRSIWLRLAKLEKAGANLHKDARTKLERLAEQYPDCSLEQDEREEFPSWTESGDWIPPAPKPTPRRRRALVEWLRNNREFNFREPEDDWRWRCRNNFLTVARALRALADEDVWPPDRWRAALFIWSEEGPDGLAKRSWRHLAPVLADAPADLVQSVDYAIGKWLESIAAVFDEHEESFTKLCGRVLEVNRQQGSDDGETGDVGDLPTKAINHPVGKVTEALFRWWGRQSLQDGQGLSGSLRDMLTDLCNPDVKNFRHGRVLLATQVIALFRVDREWTTTHLWPLFDWQSPSEASAAWQGFLLWRHLYRPFHPPLMEAIKPHFKPHLLATAEHYDELGGQGAQYSGSLAITALNHLDIFDPGELVKAHASLPPDGLYQTAHTLVRKLNSVPEPKRSDYWENRMRPYLESAWPQSRRHATRNISRCFAELCVAARDKFPEAIETLDPWLQRLPFLGSAMDNLSKSDPDRPSLCQRFPAPALRFLDKIVADNYDLYHGLDKLRICLQSILEADLCWADDPELQRQFRRLENILNQHGIDLD